VRIVLSLLKWVFITLALVLVAVIGLPWLPVAKDTLTAGPAKAYLNEYAFGFDIERPDPRLALPDSVYDARLVMLSEMHGFADVQELDFMMVQHLAERTGTRIYLGELSPAQAIAFNKMVLDGDDSAARQVFDIWAKGTFQWGNQQFFDKLRALRAYNQSQPDGSKIVFVGVDKIADREFAATMAGDLGAPLAPGFETLGNIRDINQVLLADALARSEDAGRYANILPNIETMLAMPGGEDETFYALWGMFHGSKKTINDAKPLAMRLNESSGLKGAVATVTVVCIQECYNMMPAIAVPGIDGPNGEEYIIFPMAVDNPYFRRLRGAGEIVAAMEDRGADALLVPTAEEGTPYAEGPRLKGTSGYLDMILPSFVYDASPAEFTDAVIFLRNSPALEPWSGDVYDISGRALTDER